MNSDIMADNIVDTNSMAGKVVTILIALLFIVVLAFPIANTLGNGSGESGGSDSPVTVSNEQYVLSKMAYGTNPTFEITPTDEMYSISFEGQDMNLAYRMPVLYADSTTVIYRTVADMGMPIGDYVFHITGEDIDDNLTTQNVSDISKVSSDGQTVTVDYVDGDNNSQQYTFDIASPCYYPDTNGEYGVYFNPSAFLNAPIDVLDYTSLSIPNDYTPHIIGNSNMILFMGYDIGHLWGVMADIKYQPTEYYNISNNQITNAGWEVSYRNSSEVTEDCPCMFLILPNKVTYTPSNTLDNPEPYSLRYKYAEGTIPDFSIDYTAPSGSDAVVINTSDGAIEIDSSKDNLSYVVFVSNEAVFTYSRGFVYATHDGDMYGVIEGSLECVGGQLSLVPANNGIVDIIQNAPISEPVSLGTVDWCYYASPLGEYGNYMDTQIENGLYYDSTKPVYSYGVCDAGMIFKDFELIMSSQPSVESVTSTIATSDNLYTGTTWTGGTLAEDDAVESYWTILPTSVSVDDGGNGGSGVGGVAGTLIKLVPILMIIGLLMMFIVPMVYKPN